MGRRSNGSGNTHRSCVIAGTAVLLEPRRLRLGRHVKIMDHVVIGAPNACKDTFDIEKHRRVILQDWVVIYPFSVVFEGATLRRKVVMEERTSVGSRSTVGEASRILYQAQINDNVTIGQRCMIVGFVADNTKIGDGCSVFGALVHRYKTSNTRRWGTEDELGPILEDKVVIGWGAVIVGRVRIRTGSWIRPNTVVTRDVSRGERV